MPTIGYSLGQSSLKIDGITLIKSKPPGCAINFSTMVHWARHKFTVSTKRTNGGIEVYVTLNVPEAGPMKGTEIRGSANLGVLEPGRYPVLFYFRRKGGNIVEEYQLANCLVLVAEGVPSLITPSDSSGWCAWINIMPPGPPSLHVTGKIKVKDKKTVVNLVRAVPQGFNPKILLLELNAMPSPIATEPVQKVHFSEIVSVSNYSSIDVRFPNGGCLPEPLEEIKIVT